MSFRGLLVDWFNKESLSYFISDPSLCISGARVSCSSKSQNNPEDLSYFISETGEGTDEDPFSAVTEDEAE